MKKITLLLLAICFVAATQAQQHSDALLTAVSRLDKAVSPKDYEALEKEFSNIAVTRKTEWLPYYYAALCNAQIGFLYQDDGEKIEPYSNKGADQANTALHLLDTAHQKQELSELYVVMSMINRTKVFINPMTYGRKYGPVAEQYLKEAKRLNPQNPRMLYASAWVKYYTPKLWGGDKGQAKQLAEESLKLLAAQSADNVAPHWGKTSNEALLQKMK
ncbi:hypothetical protein CLV59_101539 [Chitinophaga dinghuensis]|uniref:Tetratricopeptide repeat protein n=1 Tax=Chitinophaga dinghuensis TaxID=1539050 RepID=A0A327WCC1_9BACT|nr:hypothetical protein [Chitinophaga dinghuensis]RAJ87778.1 hypothetical protein CLV59_101539 [Chitinophaga dinghuensis]